MIFVDVGEVISESQRQGNTGWTTVGVVVGFTIIMILDVASG
jgi:ZIP family zinc transporter